MSTQRVSDKVAAQLRALVQERQLQPGDRLPAERTLALRDTPAFMALAHEVREALADGHH